MVSIPSGVKSIASLLILTRGKLSSPATKMVVFDPIANVVDTVVNVNPWSFTNDKLVLPQGIEMYDAMLPNVVFEKMSVIDKEGEVENSFINRTLQALDSEETTTRKQINKMLSFVIISCIYLLSNYCSTVGAFHENVEVDVDDYVSTFGKEKIGDERDIDCISRLFRDYVPPRRLQTDGTTNGGCESLDQNTKAWFAVALAACKLELMGRPSLPIVCTDKAKIQSTGGYTTESLKLCGRAMDLEQSQAHTTFLAHADNLCFYMEARSWKREQQAVMLALEASSNSTAHKLENISASASDAVALNKAALSHAELLGSRLIETDKHLTAMANRQESSYSTISSTLSTLESYSATLLYLNSLFTTQLLVIQSVSFYSVIMWILWTVTAQPQAMKARFWVIVGLALALMVEGLLVKRATRSAGYASFSFSFMDTQSDVNNTKNTTSNTNTRSYSTEGLPSWQAGFSDLLHYLVYPTLELAGWLFEYLGSSLATIISKISGGASDEVLQNVLRGFLSSYDSGRLDVNPLLWNVRFGFLLYASLCVLVAVYTHVDYSKITVDMLTQTVDMVSRLREEQKHLLESVKSEVSKMSQLKSSPFKWSPFPASATSATTRDVSSSAASRRAEMEIEKAAAIETSSSSSSSFVQGVGAFISQSIFGAPPKTESSALSLIVNTHSSATARIQRKRASSSGLAVSIAGVSSSSTSAHDVISSSLQVTESTDFDEDDTTQDPDYNVDEDLFAEISGQDYLPELTLPYSSDPRTVMQAYLESDAAMEDQGDPVSVSPQLLNAPGISISSSGKKRSRRASTDVGLVGAGTGLDQIYRSPAVQPQDLTLSTLDSPLGPPIVRNYREILRPRKETVRFHNPIVEHESPHAFAFTVGISRMITMLRSVFAGDAVGDEIDLPEDEDDIDSDDDDDNDNAEGENGVNVQQVSAPSQIFTSTVPAPSKPISELLDEFTESMPQRAASKRLSVLGKRSSMSSLLPENSPSGKRRQG